MKSLPRRQHGAVAFTVVLLLLFLLGFMGISLDLSRMFVVQSELQTAMDSCALAAAQELDLQPSINGSPSAIDRARNAGRTAGNLNAVNFQSGTWSGKGQLENTDITFKDVDYVPTTDPTLAQYVECQHVQSGVQMWLMQAMGAVTGNTAQYPNTRNVMARAVATRAHGQTTCPLPVALKPKETCGGPCPKPDYGLVPGEWVTMLTEEDEFVGGQIGWMSLTEDPGLDAIREQLNGYCGTKVKDELKPSDSGTKIALAEPWNYRFGVYKKLPDFSTDPGFMHPDSSGYAYNSTSWTSESNAWSDFVIKRSNNASCASGIANCRASSGASVQSPFKDPLASTSDHAAWGSNRRVVTVPVIDASNKVIDFACMLMLAPLSIPMSNTKLEYIGNASLQTSPCSFSGIPGGDGPRVPALVE